MVSARQIERLSAPKRREMLINTAIPIFAAKGFYAATMEEVASAAGITKPVIYQHFKSKHDLYKATLDQVGVWIIETLSNATSGHLTPHQRFQKGFEAYFRFVYENKAAFELMFASSPRRDSEFRQVILDVEENMANNITSEIDADLDESHRHLVATGVQAFATGIARRYLREHSKEVDEMGNPLPFEDSLANRWSLRMADLMWAGLRGIHRDSL